VRPRHEDAVGPVVEGEEDAAVPEARGGGPHDVREDRVEGKVRLQLARGAEDPLERLRAVTERLVRLVQPVP
jgi:hypothetical protein